MNLQAVRAEAAKMSNCNSLVRASDFANNYAALTSCPKIVDFSQLKGTSVYENFKDKF